MADFSKITEGVATLTDIDKLLLLIRSFFHQHKIIILIVMILIVLVCLIIFFYYSKRNKYLEDISETLFYLKINKYSFKKVRWIKKCIYIFYIIELKIKNFFYRIMKRFKKEEHK